jgi:hypothetical protein
MNTINYKSNPPSPEAVKAYNHLISKGWTKAPLRSPPIHVFKDKGLAYYNKQMNDWEEGIRGRLLK